ncbi:MAG TPA: AraC family transcriptional regulator, partial [Ktedonobacterales bacterium]|nr:AraC family transcriptional regulator [Ktedonobacterales bacterium]
QLVCGYLHCDQRFNPLLGALPELLVVHPCDTEAEVGLPPLTAQAPSAVLAIQSGDWLQTTLRHTIEEALGERPGKSEMMARLSEILFVEIVRRYMQQLPFTQHGWLAGVRDPLVGQTLRLLHAHPEQAWTVEALADEVAVSRSTLAQRFTTFVGETPMRYLAVWRMQLAKYLLKQTTLNVGEVAQRVGYESDVAFNRAFRRHVGQPPATWRAAFDSPSEQRETSSTLIS